MWTVLAWIVGVVVVVFVIFMLVMGAFAGTSDPTSGRKLPRYPEDADPLPGDGLDREQHEREQWKK